MQIPSDVAAAYALLPDAIRDRLLELRQLIFETAESTPEVGPLTEALRWGQPSYLTEESRSGTTVRLGWSEKQPEEYALFVHCQTSLVESFREALPPGVEARGNRALVMQATQPPPEQLRDFIAAALTYHRR